MQLTSPRIRIFVGILAALLFVMYGLARDASAAPMTFVVNSELDTNDHICDTSCTFADAIDAANANPGSDTIHFDATKFPPNGTGPVLQLATIPLIYGTDGVTIDGVGAGVDLVSDGGDFALQIVTVPTMNLHDVTIRHLNMEGFAKDSILICAGGAVPPCHKDVTNVTIEDVFADQGEIGVHIEGANISNVTITNARTFGTGRGIYIVGGGALEGNTISGVSISGADIDTTTTTHGIEVTGPVLENFSVADSTVENTADDGIVLNMAYVNDSTVSGNTLTSVDNGVRVYAGEAVDGLAITGNGIAPQALGTDIDVTGGHGLSNVNISDNTATGGSIGIRIETGGTSSNIDVGLNEAAVKNNGILVDGPLTDTVLHDNTLTSAFGDAIRNDGSGSHVTFSHNETHSTNSVGLGINLAVLADPSGGVTPNDPGDGDSGPNDLLNFPEFGGSNAQFVDGTACPDCTIELFLSDGNSNLHGGSAAAITHTEADSNGDFTLSICGKSLAAGTKVTATATDSQGNTSEFSLNFALTEAAGPCPTASPSPTHSPTPTASPTATPTPSSSASPTGAAERTQGNLDCDGSVTVRDGLIAGLFRVGLSLLSRQAGCPGLTDGSPDFADVNCDGVIDERDMVEIVAYSAGVPKDNGACTDIGQPLW